MYKPQKLPAHQPVGIDILSVELYLDRQLFENAIKQYLLIFMVF